MSLVTNECSWWKLFSRDARDNSDNEIESILSQAASSDLIAFSGGFPDPATFPTEEFLETFPEVVADPASLQYAPTLGLPGLREWFRRWLKEREGMAPGEGELLVTSGGMEGLTLLGRCLIDRGDRVMAEGPTFMGALMALRAAGARVDAAPMDSEGLRVDDLDRDVCGPGGAPKFLYVIPDHQNPMGVSLSAERRHRLVQIARRHGILIVEDVAYRELGFDGARLPSLYSLGPDVVAQVGTFSKTFSAGLRTGWISAPAEIVRVLARAKQYTDQCSAALGQMLLERYGRSGGFDRGIASARSFYASRSRALTRALETHLPAGVEYTHPTGGFFSWLTVPDSVDSIALREEALAEGVSYVPGTAFYPDGRGAQELRLAYSKVPEEQIEEGARRLGDLLSRALRSA
ncbi:PLP-dependent aminotransferase family protein [Lipingzhangella sp. LS1_29]|uniref:PLP-dependent aminotransferase family protein n=1 Tax=Lipingzhangella rawalii TaxID=2055835 RepID=A0ABU2HCM9_9ACTN|nr:PLP-dependent aminotransferase family protein [Lipingzhangella rawalii]MDS1272595.1 PLP-dependent aminotransferase family protein [Lipingzhangella rawalii]